MLWGVFAIGCVCFGWKSFPEMLFQKWGCLVGPENSIFRKLKSVDPKKKLLTTEMLLHFYFPFKSFPENERERESAHVRERRRSSPRSRAPAPVQDRDRWRDLAKARSRSRRRSRSRIAIDGAVVELETFSSLMIFFSRLWFVFSRFVFSFFFSKH